MKTSDIEWVPFGQYDVHDGWRIDGSKVRFWGAKGQAKAAAKSIGFPVKSVIKVHTRFQVGWALGDGRFGLLSRDDFGRLYHSRQKTIAPQANSDREIKLRKNRLMNG
jgi:hypothetical protein